MLVVLASLGRLIHGVSNTSFPGIEEMSLLLILGFFQGSRFKMRTQLIAHLLLEW